MLIQRVLFLSVRKLNKTLSNKMSNKKLFILKLIWIYGEVKL